MKGRIGTIVVGSLASVATALSLAVGCAVGDNASLAPDDVDPNLPEVDASSKGQPVPGPSSGSSSSSGGSGSDASSSGDAGLVASDAAPPKDAATPDAPPTIAKPAQGEVLITEVMYDTLGTEPATEWFEVYNAASSQRSLTGLVIRDGGNRTHVIGGNVVIAPQSYAVFVRDKATSLTAKVPSAAIVYEYGTGLPDNAGIILANGDTGGLWLAYGSTTIAQAPYGGWYSQSGGSSVQLKALTYGDGSNKNSWCLSFNTWTTGSAKGTPGAAEDCP